MDEKLYHRERLQNMNFRGKENETDNHSYFSNLMTTFKEESISFRNDSSDDKNFMSCFHKYAHNQEKMSASTGCHTKFDGISCWPYTPPGSLRVIPCFTELFGVMYDNSGNASLWCDANGNWASKASYESCQAIKPSEPNLSGNTINIIFYIGNSISLVAVIMALWIFLYFKDLRCLRNTIHTNLLATYFLHNVCWISSASLQSYLSTPVSCCFFVALNFVTVTNFMWMFVEGLFLYMLVVKTFSVEDIDSKVYLLIGWGIPFPIILTWLITRTNVTEDDKSHETAYDGTCFLIQESNLDWLIKVPVLVILTFNIIFLIRIMWVLITKLRSPNVHSAETQRYWKASKALLVLIPLLGLTYMLLIALPQDFEHFRAVLLSTQGFWVSLVYCFLNSEVRNSMRHHIRRWNTERGIAINRETSLKQMRENSQRRNRKPFCWTILGWKRESVLSSEGNTLTTSTGNGYGSRRSTSPKIMHQSSQEGQLTGPVKTKYSSSGSSPANVPNSKYNSAEEDLSNCKLLSSTAAKEIDNKE